MNHLRKWTTERSGNWRNVAQVRFLTASALPLLAWWHKQYQACQTSGTAIPHMFPWSLWQRCPYTVSQKTSHLWLAVTLTYVNGFWYFFGSNVTNKVSNQKTLYMPPQITGASPLPGKMGKHKICIFHSNAVLAHCRNSTSCLISSVFLTYASQWRCCMTF